MDRRATDRPGAGLPADGAMRRYSGLFELVTIWCPDHDPQSPG